MLTLPDKIKNDLSGNLSNAQYLVAIKTNPIIYISNTKQMFDDSNPEEFNLIYYEDLDLNLSNIKERIDIKTKKIQLSSMSMSFSNFPVGGLRLSDKLLDGLGKEISVYLKTASCNSIGDCIKLADLKVTRYSHDENSVKINADDIRLESFYVDLPRESSILKKDENTFEAYHSKPVPILYGRLENAPAIPYYESETYGLAEVLLLFDDSYLNTRDVGGIKFFEQSIPFDSLISPNVLKIKLGDDLCDVPCKRYVNSREELVDKFEYPQYETHGDYIKLVNNYNEKDTMFLNYKALYCSAVKKATLDTVIRYEYSETGNSYTYQDSSYNTSHIVEIESGIDPTGANESWTTGVVTYRIDPLSGVDVYTPENDDPLYSINENYFKEIPDVHFIGNATLEIEPYQNFDNTLDYDVFGFYGKIYHNEELNEDEEGGAEIGNSEIFEIGLEWNATVAWNRLIWYTKHHNRVKSLGDTAGNQYLSYFNAGFYNTVGTYSDDSNNFANYGTQNARRPYSPAVDASVLSMFYHFEYQSTESLGNQHDSSADITTRWSNNELFVRKTWLNANVLEKDFFVNAKGRLGDAISGSNKILGIIKSWYGSPETPTDFTSQRNKHLTELYRILTNKSYARKVIDGEEYELMFRTPNESGSMNYIYDIEVNNFIATTDLTGIYDEDEDVKIYNEADGTYAAINHNHGWFFLITAQQSNYGIFYPGYGGDISFAGGLQLGYGRKNIVNGALVGIVNFKSNHFETDIAGTSYDILAGFNESNLAYIPSGAAPPPGEPEPEEDQDAYISGYTRISWNNGEVVENPARLLESPEEIIQDLVSSELNIVESVEIPESTNMRIAFSINEQKNSKDIIENICRQSNLMFRYRASDGSAVLNSIKKTYTAQNDLKKTIDSSKILKYKFDKTKIEDLCFGGCRVKWELNYGKNELINTTPDINVGDTMSDYKDHYGVDDETKYQLEIEAPFINNEASALTLRNFMFNYYKNTHLIIKFTLPLSEGIEVEVGDVIDFNDEINGLRPYGWSIATGIKTKNNQTVYPYFIVTSVSKSLSKVDLEVVQLHDLTGDVIDNDDTDTDTDDDIVFITGCTDPNASNYDPSAVFDDGSCEYAGCMDENADNYDPDAEISDSTSCVYSSPEYPIAEGNVDIWVEDADGNPVTNVVGGVGQRMYVNADNCYDPDPLPETSYPNGIHSWEWIASPTIYNQIHEEYDLPGDMTTGQFLISGDLGSSFSFEITDDMVGEEPISFGLEIFDEDGNSTNWSSESLYPGGILVNPSGETLPGDINFDDYLDVLDVIQIVNFIIAPHSGTDYESFGWSPQQFEAADYNNDGVVNVQDVVHVVNTILGN